MMTKDRKCARVALVAAMIAASTWAGEGLAAASSPTASEAAIASNVMALLNSERAANGLPALRGSSGLAASARAHNAKMAAANVMSHQLPGEPALGARVTQVGVNWHNVAENIGWTTDRTVNGARGMQVMMYQEKAPDDGHRLNILSAAVNYVGVDVTIDARTGKLWLTEDFADATNAVATSAPRPTVTNHNPSGSLDRVTVLPGNKVRITGWAVDPDNRAQPLAIAVYYDGKGIGWIRQPAARADVSRAKNAGPQQGFDITVALPAGTHTVSAYAINIGAGTSNPRLGAATVRT